MRYKILTTDLLKSVEIWGTYAGINFIHNHPPWKNPRDTTWREQKSSPRDNTESQKPHLRDIKLENFTNVSINSDTIWNEKLCGLNKLNGFSIRRLNY